MPRPNSTAIADSTGLKRCSSCGKRKRASRVPSESCFYVVSRKPRARKSGSIGERVFEYMHCCKTCNRIKCSEIRRRIGSRYTKKWYDRLREDPGRYAAYLEGKRAYRRRHQSSVQRTKRRWRDTAIGHLTHARWQNRKRLADALASQRDRIGRSSRTERIARLTALIAAQDAELARMRAIREMEKVRDADPRLYNKTTFRRLLNNIHDPGERTQTHGD
jgi:hypothetical protein